MSNNGFLLNLSQVFRNDVIRTLFYIVFAVVSYIAATSSSYFFFFSEEIVSYFAGVVALFFWLYVSAVLIRNRNSVRPRFCRNLIVVFITIMLLISIPTIYLCVASLFSIAESTPVLVGGVFPIENMEDQNLFKLYLMFGYGMLMEIKEKIGIFPIFFILSIYTLVCISMILYFPRKQ